MLIHIQFKIGEINFIRYKVIEKDGIKEKLLRVELM